MTRKVLPACLWVSVVASTASLGLLSVPGTAPARTAYAADEAVASVSDFMIVVNGQGGILGQLRDAFDGAGPAGDKDWKVAKAKAAVIQALAGAVLAKGTPNKGEEDSWKHFVGGYSERAKALAGAVAKQDAAAAKEELGALGKTCAGCHKAHK